MRALAVIAALFILLAGHPARAAEVMSPRLQAIQDARARREFAHAEQMSRDYLNELESAGQGDGLEAAAAIDLLTELLRAKSAISEARPLALRSLAIRKALLSPNDPLIARSLRRLGQLATAENHYREAKEYLTQALAILEGSAADEKELADTMTSLGIAERNLWELTRARTHHERALALQRKLTGEDSLDYARRLSNLANVLYDQGELPAARDMYEQIDRIYRRNLPRTDSIALRMTNNLANAEGRLGNCARAIRLERSILAVADSAAMIDWTGRPSTLLSLAEDLMACGDPEAARDAIEQSIEILEANGRGAERLTAKAYVTLGKIRVGAGEYATAVDAFRRASVIAAGAVSASDPLRAVPLHHSARALMRGGDAEAAEREFDQARRVLQASPLPDLETLLDTYDVGAQVAFRRGEVQEARARARQANDYGRRFFLGLVRGLPEREALQSASKCRVGLDLLCRSAIDAPSSAVIEAWDAVIRSRTRVLDELARRRNLSSDPDSTTRALLTQLREARSSVANRELLLAESEPTEQGASELALLQESRDLSERLERELALKSTRFEREREDDALGYTEVAAALPEGSALIAYVRVAALWDSLPARYGAFVLAGGHDAAYIDLGAASAIEDAVTLWQRDASSVPTGKLAEASYRFAAKELRRLIYDPLLPALPASGTLYIVPDGALHLVSFAALPDDNDGYLVEGDRLIHMLACERTLARTREHEASGSLLALGDVDFQNAEGRSNRGPAILASSAPSAITLQRQAIKPCADGRAMRFDPLLGSAEEVEAASRSWHCAQSGSDSEPARGAEASEALFRRAAPDAAVIHAATHGFFFDPDCAQRSVGYVSPLALSGLALAGANQWTKALDPTNDGLLTAEEIGTLDLSRAQWAVLSACGSGRGQIAEGEGILGLERAFEIAGARTVIASLWSVSDRATVDWMSALYRARWEERQPTDEAMRAASRAALAERRRHGESTHPFYWGAFVAYGE